MNWSHLSATLWIRWRMLINRIKRAGKLGNTIFVLLSVFAVLVGGFIFMAAYEIGSNELADASPMGVMYTWLGLGIGFLFFWTIGLITDLQRGDAMSLKHLLHLPISLRWVFLYNYTSSYVSLSMALFLPAMFGLTAGMVAARGAAMLGTLLLILAYLCMVTALTYQLRGWLGRLMEDKRKGRNIVAIITVTFVILLQVPNLINIAVNNERGETRRQDRLELAAEIEALQAGADSSDESQAQSDDHSVDTAPEESASDTDPSALGPEEEETEPATEADIRRAKREQRKIAQAARNEEIEAWVELAAKVIPVGWLSYGVRSAYQGQWLSYLLCLVGMAGIGLVSLQRSYRSTLDSVMGLVSDRAAKSPTAKQLSEKEPIVTEGFLVERDLPLVSDQPAAVAMASLRSTLRAPEAKIMFLSPVILLALFGVMLSGQPAQNNLQSFAPMLSLGAISMGLFSILQLIQNQFGLDRDGFRGYVLSPIPRDQILLGKNLAVAPIGLSIGLIALIGLQFFVPSTWPHFLGSCLQLVSAFMLCCLVGNFISIMGPMRLKPGGMKASNAKWRTVLWQLFSIVLLPLAFLPLLLPSGLAFLFRHSGWMKFPLTYPALHALLLVIVYWGYRFILKMEGELLQDREQRILMALTRD
ncbi:MAG: ABC-2 type transport system permease protein [Planctomycetota bacterium]